MALRLKPRSLQRSACGMRSSRQQGQLRLAGFGGGKVLVAVDVCSFDGSLLLKNSLQMSVVERRAFAFTREVHSNFVKIFRGR